MLNAPCVIICFEQKSKIVFWTLIVIIVRLHLLLVPPQRQGAK